MGEGKSVEGKNVELSVSSSAKHLQTRKHFIYYCSNLLPFHFSCTFVGF